MPVYNGAKHLAAALQSILSQTVEDFEFLIIDDCSTDETPQLLSQCSDRRLRVLRNPTNLGVTKSLNVGLGEARGRYLARMDADDIALPHRFAVQVQLLERSESGMTHSRVEFIDGEGQRTGLSSFDTDPLTVTWKMLFDSHGFHPTFMWKRELVERLVGEYDESFEVAQDFDLAWRALRKVGLEGTDQILLQYRMHGGNITGNKRSRQQSLVAAASVAHIADYLSISRQAAEEEFSDVRELAIFRDPQEWTVERVNSALPRYVNLWEKFLAISKSPAWHERPEGLRKAALKDLINATGILIAARDLTSLRRCLRLVSNSGVAPTSVLLPAIFRRRLKEKLGAQAAFIEGSRREETDPSRRSGF